MLSTLLVTIALKVSPIKGTLKLNSYGFKSVHWSEVKIKREVPLKYPKAAKALNLGDQRCVVRFEIDQKGKPTKITIKKCPKVFHAVLTKSCMKWRFYPVTSESGQKVRAAFVMGVTFQLK